MPTRATIAESILAALTEPLLVLDESLRAVVANRAFYTVLQIPAGKLEGKSVQELIQAHGPSQLPRILEAVVADPACVEGCEIQFEIPPNTLKVMTVTVQRVAVADVPTELILIELRDITRDREATRRIQELNEALQRHGIDLQEINQELESFTHSVSHDLRSPLRLTNRIAHLLLQDYADTLPADAVKKIHMILDSTQQMGKLMEDLLLFSRVSREPMKKRRVDLRKLTLEALDELEDERQRRDVSITIEQLPSCLGDRPLLKQVLVNLLANALKFTRPRARAEIHVGFTERAGETLYTVRDNGVGFDMSQTPVMFLAFRRLHKSQDFEGSGVGLALVKRIVERHGGRIWAEGEPDKGAIFYFSLGPGGTPV